MSSAEQQLAHSAPDVIAALVWDKPALRATEAVGAKAFVEAFGALGTDVGESSDDDVLWRAARGVVLARGGDYAASAEHFDYLRTRSDAWVRLLGMLLLAWSAGSEDRALLDEVRDLARHIPEVQLRARILNKASLFAYDKDWQKLGDSLLLEAHQVSEPESALRAVLEWGAFNRGIHDELPASEVRLDDELVALPWVGDTALAGAREALELQAEERMSATWTWTFRMGGRTPLDQMSAAETQATWAGAFWMRNWIRKELGAHLLSGAASTSAQWAYGVAAWALGGGKVGSAFRLAEPHLDGPGVDLVVDTLAKEAGRNAELRFRELVIAAWDVISDRSATALFERVAIEPVAHRALADAQRIWGLLLWRLPEQWTSHYGRLSEEQRRSLVPELSPDALRPLDLDLRKDILALTLEEIESGAAGEWTFYLAASLADALGDDEIFERVIAADPPAGDLVMIAEEYGDRDLEEVLAAKEQLLVKIVEEANHKALHGPEISFGASSPRIQLGRLGALRRIHAPPGVRVLLETASMPELPGEFRSEARQGLTLLHRAGKVDEGQFEVLRAASDQQSQSAFHGITTRLLEIFRLQALAPLLSAEERIVVVGSCRDPDPRVRVIAMDVCSETLKPSLSDESLVWGLVSGLFDPAEEVVRASLFAVGEGRLSQVASAMQVVVHRLPKIYELASASTRAEVAYSAGRLLGAAAEADALEGLMKLALADKSWRVRQAASEAVQP